MTKLTHYVPNLFTNIFDDFSVPSYIIKPLHGSPLQNSFKVDIKEAPGEYSIKAEIPGVKKEDIHISVDGGIVTIQAETSQHDQKKENEKVVQSECYYGTVFRSFQLPVEIDQGNTKANYENGVLKLVLPKKNGSKPHQIKVS